MSLRPVLEISETIAQSIIHGAFPGCPVQSIATIHGGEIAAVFEIGLADGHRSVVLKVYPDSLHWKMKKEQRVLSLIQDRLGVAAPHVLLADDSKRLLDLNYILMTKLDGSSLGRLEASLAPEQLESAYRQIGALLRQFHLIPMEAFGYIGPSGIWTEHATNHGYLSFQFERKISDFVQRGGSAALSQRIAACVAEQSHLLFACEQPVLCHNDLHAGNLLAHVTADTIRLSGVLDFENALAGDPLMDIAKACFYLDGPASQAVIEGYGETGRRHWRETLRFYHLYFVLELWCWFAQIGNHQRLDKLTDDLRRLSTA